ncbi:MAG: hypothetical protein LBP60_07460 [Spirochaetaceae bacterium]|nr:hypothetical protein [Spirochaetaceae bacterium]
MLPSTEGRTPLTGLRLVDFVPPPVYCFPKAVSVGMLMKGRYINGVTDT